MNTDILQGKWRQIQGDVKRKWGDLTDDDISRINGDHDKLVGVIQEKYGYSRDRAQTEVDKFLKSYDTDTKNM